MIKPTNDNEQDLGIVRFLSETRADVQRFEGWWCAQHENEVKLSRAEWWEQFLLFLDTEDMEMENKEEGRDG